MIAKEKPYKLMGSEAFCRRTVMVVPENFASNLQSFTGNVMSEQKDAFMAQVEAAQKAGEPIQAKQQEGLDLTILRMQEQAKSAAQPKLLDNLGTTPEKVAA